MNDTFMHNNPTQETSIDPIDTVERLRPEEIDERYIQAYLEQPGKGKIDALRTAGHPHPTRQRAWQLHERLLDQIDKELDRLILQDAALGRSVLVDLAKSSQSDSVKASSASKLMEYAGKQKADRVIVENRSFEDIDAEIALVKKRILEAQGCATPENELH